MRVAVLAVSALLAVGCGTPDTKAPRDASAPAGAEAGGAAASASGATASASAPSAAWREVTIPAGTRLPIVLETSVGSDTSHVEERVQARLARPVVHEGATVIEEGSDVSGVVTDATRSAKVKGRAHLAIRFDTLVPRGRDERYAIRTAPVAETAEATKGKDAVKILAPAAGGAIIGRIFGGRKGALVGAAAGGGAGTAVVLSTRGKEVRLARGAALTLRLEQPLTIKIPA